MFYVLKWVEIKRLSEPPLYVPIDYSLHNFFLLKTTSDVLSGVQVSSVRDLRYIWQCGQVLGLLEN